MKFKHFFPFLIIAVAIAIVAVKIIPSPADDLVKQSEALDHIITSDEATVLINNYKYNKSVVEYPADYEEFYLPQVERLLAQEGADAFRIYNGATDDNRHVFVMAVVDENGNRLPIHLEKGAACPPYCDNGVSAK